MASEKPQPEKKIAAFFKLIGDYFRIRVRRLLRGAVPTNVWFHQHDVAARDEALHSPKLFHGLSRQLSGIVPFDDRYLRERRIGRYRMAAFHVGSDRYLGVRTALAQPHRKACRSRSNPGSPEQADQRLTTAQNLFAAIDLLRNGHAPYPLLRFSRI